MLNAAQKAALLKTIEAAETAAAAARAAYQEAISDSLFSDGEAAAKSAKKARAAELRAKDAAKAAQAAAQKYLEIETLETRRSDELDFHEVSVWGLKEALEQAYLAGRNAR